METHYFLKSGAKVGIPMFIQKGKLLFFLFPIACKDSGCLPPGICSCRVISGVGGTGCRAGGSEVGFSTAALGQLKDFAKTKCHFLSKNCQLRVRAKLLDVIVKNCHNLLNTCLPAGVLILSPKNFSAPRFPSRTS